MICAYPTVKYVKIQDTRLVVLRYTMILIIVLYVGFFEMFAGGGWLQASPVEGTVRFSLQHPTIDNCDPALDGCNNAFAPLESLPYCMQADIQSKGGRYEQERQRYAGSIYPCEIYEAINAQVVHEKSLTVITRASTLRQSFACPTMSAASNINNVDETTAQTNAAICNRTYENLEQEYKFYTAESESFTILIDHAVTSSKICTSHANRNFGSTKPSYACSAEASSYEGRLYSRDEHLCQREHNLTNAFRDSRGSAEATGAPCYINPNKTKSSNQDFFSLDVLLQAAGVYLDDCNEKAQESNNKTCQTYRETGAAVLLSIYWSDFVPYHGIVRPHYYYMPQIVARSSYKQYIPFYDNNYRESRTLLNAHGIRLAVLLGGEFNQFNVLTFLVTLTTTLGLLAVATTIVDGLMLYILPEKRRYQQAKYEVTEAFEGNDVVSSTVAGLGQLLIGNQPGQQERLNGENAVTKSADTSAMDPASGGNAEDLFGNVGGSLEPLLPRESRDTVES